MDEIKRVFGNATSEAELKQIMKEADTNGDNIITFDEFVEMMRKYAAENFEHQARWSIN